LEFAQKLFQEVCDILDIDSDKVKLW
jgi:hypothetical protein